MRAVRRLIAALGASAALALAAGCARTCDDIDGDARSALDGDRACTADAECTAVLLSDSCVTDFICWAPVTTSADPARVRAVLSQASRERGAMGCSCPVTRCAPAPAVACVEGRCSFPAR